jgi:uncharacterized protein YsxB (DUF464 family)
LITVAVIRGRRGNLVSAAASGHAGKGKRGTDIVCSAATVLLRTTVSVLAGSLDPAIEVKTAGRGSLAFRVTAFKETDIPVLKYAADFLLEGLASLQREYPEAIEMRIDDSDD